MIQSSFSHTQPVIFPSLSQNVSTNHFPYHGTVTVLVTTYDRACRQLEKLYRIEVVGSRVGRGTNYKLSKMCQQGSQNGEERKSCHDHISLPPLTWLDFSITCFSTLNKPHEFQCENKFQFLQKTYFKLVLQMKKYVLRTFLSLILSIHLIESVTCNIPIFMSLKLIPLFSFSSVTSFNDTQWWWWEASYFVPTEKRDLYGLFLSH